MKKFAIFLVLASAILFNGCKSNSATLPRPVSWDYEHRAFQRHGADPITNALTLEYSDAVYPQDLAVDGYPIIAYYTDDLTPILAVVIDHSGTSCSRGLVSVNNYSISQGSYYSYSSIDLGEKNQKKINKPKLMTKASKVETLGTVSHVDSPVPTPRMPRPPFRVNNGYTVCEIVPDSSNRSGSARNIYDLLGFEY